MISQDTSTSLTSGTSSKADEYWNSDHHRFEWTNFMQNLDPLSWHALAISYPDSFLKGISQIYFIQIAIANFTLNTDYSLHCLS